MSIPKVASPFFGEDAHGPFAGAARRLTASALTAGSSLLARLAVSLIEAPCSRSSALPQLEFHAEAGAPEGALYVDGRLVGYLPGVTRL